MNPKCPLPRGPVPLLKGLPGTDDVGPNIFDGRAVLRMLKNEYGILARVGHYDNERSDAVGAHTVGFNFRRGFECFVIMAHAFCGDSFLGMFEGRVLKYEDIRKAATAAATNHDIRDLLVHATKLTFKLAKEFDSALRMWSVEEVSFHLYSHMVGRYHLGELMRFILNLLEGRGTGGMSIETMKRMVTYKYSWLFHDMGKDACSFVRQAVHMAEKMKREGDIDFTRLVRQLKSMTSRTPIPADAVAAVALAELGYILECEPSSKRILRHIAGERGRPIHGWIMLTYEAACWLTPLKTHTSDRTVLALNGRAWLRPQQEWTTPGSCSYTPAAPLEGYPMSFTVPDPFVHVDIAGRASFSAFSKLKKPDSCWNDKLEEKLRQLEEEKFPLGGVEASTVIQNARHAFSSTAPWKSVYTKTLMSTPRTVAAYFHARRTGLSLREVLYRQGLRMFHPHITRMRGEPLILFLTDQRAVRNEEEEILGELKYLYRQLLCNFDANGDGA